MSTFTLMTFNRGKAAMPPLRAGPTLLLLPPVRHAFDVICDGFEGIDRPGTGGTEFTRAMRIEGWPPLSLKWQGVGRTAGVAHLVYAGGGEQMDRQVSDVIAVLGGRDGREDSTALAVAAQALEGLGQPEPTQTVALARQVPGPVLATFHTEGVRYSSPMDYLGISLGIAFFLRLESADVARAESGRAAEIRRRRAEGGEGPLPPDRPRGSSPPPTDPPGGA